MGRLTNLKPRVASMPPRLKRQTDDHGHDAGAEPWRLWYHLARWKRLRQDVFLRDLYRCCCGCGVVETDTSKLVADHIEPHRGDEALFWDPKNLQTLLEACHNGWKQRQERRRL